MDELVSLGPGDLALAALLMLIPALVSVGLKLGLGGQLAVASLRSVVQLSLLGLVLVWVFDLGRWYFVLPVLLLMLIAASRAAIHRSSRRVPGSHLQAFAALVLASSVTVFTVTEVVIGVDPWYAPQYVIPLVGMMLGNALTGISLGLDRLLADLVERRAAIEARLCLGAPLWLAVRPWMRTAVRTSMVPILNAMSVVGVVSLPGMMTGQILAGASPRDAVSYQILIMFMIASVTAIASIALCLATYWTLADSRHRLRWDRILERARDA
jgi:putative ABC transport system permease protein